MRAKDAGRCFLAGRGMLTRLPNGYAKHSNRDHPVPTMLSTLLPPELRLVATIAHDTNPSASSSDPRLHKNTETHHSKSFAQQLRFSSSRTRQSPLQVQTLPFL